MLLHWACGGRASSCNGGPAVENHYPLTNTGAERGWGVTGKEFTRERGYFQGGPAGTGGRWRAKEEKPQ